MIEMMPHFAKLMTHTFTIRKQKRTHQGDFEDDSTATGVKGFVEYGRRTVINRQGEEVLCTATIFMPKDASIDSNHDYWKIDQTAPYSRVGLEVIQIDPIDDPRTGKTHHYEISVR